MPKGFYRHLSPLALVLAAGLALSGCESSEERAEGYYQSGLELLAAGDIDRALVEFRNVFKYNGFHKEARKTYADTVLARGEVAEAYGQYLRLIEQYPDTPEVRLTLAEIAITRGDWREAERHGVEAIRLAPDAPGVAAISVALDYRKAALARDAAALEAGAKRARDVLVTEPENRIALRVLIGHLSEGPNPAAALPEIDRALALEPTALELHGVKVRILAQTGDSPATGAQLKEMVRLFPDNQQVRGALIQWYLSERDFDGAETFMRELAGEATGPAEGHLAVVQLLQAARGVDAARAELDLLIAANTGTPNADLYRALAAGMEFEAGRQTEAVAEMEAILKEAAPSDQTRRIKGILARMLDGLGNRVGARARVEEILAEDAGEVEALKLRATWLIDEDRPGDAIIDLRAALDQAPRDVQILTLMAAAYERDGNLELAGERMAMAAEVSGYAPEEAMRYARFLISQGRPQVAETTLTDARRANPGNVAVLAMLADLALTARDWTSAQDIEATLRQIGTPEAERAAIAVQAGMLLGQNRTEDGLTLLQDQMNGSDEDVRAVALIVQTRLRAGNPAEARNYLDGELAKRPDDPNLRLISASLHALMGEAPAAETQFRALLQDNPGNETAARMLYGLLISTDRQADAAEVLETALAAAPKSGTLRWLKAGELEQAGDIDGAIAVYEALYEEDSTSVVVANNLASLLTTHRDDAASLDRASAIARRLRGVEVPAFQDTYGWIEFRRGNHEEALKYLEPAAAGLPGDPLTQFHLGMTYAALKRAPDARRLLTLALELAGDSPLPQFEIARQTLAGLPPDP